MSAYAKYATTVVGAHSVPDWYEALDRIVTSSCGFNHLPHAIAFGKMQAMTEAKRILGG